MSTGIVYMWVNLTNGKRRVGHTNNLNRRIIEHKHISKISNKYFYQALKKYPIEEGHWVIESLEVNRDEMLWLEKMWKVLYKTTDRKYGYDILLDEEDRSGENHPMYGKKRPEHSKRMMGEKNSFYHKHHTKENREIMRAENGSTKLTVGNIKEIRKMLNDGIPQSKIAEIFKVTQPNISYINRNKTWETIL